MKKKIHGRISMDSNPRLLLVFLQTAYDDRLYWFNHVKGLRLICSRHIYILVLEIKSNEIIIIWSIIIKRDNQSITNIKCITREQISAIRLK